MGKKRKTESPEKARISFRITHSKNQLKSLHVPNANNITTVVSKTPSKADFRHHNGNAKLEVTE